MMLAIPAQQTSAPKKQGTYDFVDLIFFTGVAIMFDVLSVIPSMGDLGLIAFRFAFWLKKVDTKFMNIMLGTGGIIEIIPAVSAIPSVTAFVVIVFFEVKMMERVKKISPKAAQALETAAGAASGDAGSVKAAAGGAGVATGAGAAAGAVSAGKGAEKMSGQATSGESAGAPQPNKPRGTLQDGSAPAEGSPIEGGEGGEESSAGVTPPDQVSQKFDKQQKEEVSPESAHKPKPELGVEQKSEGDEEGWQAKGRPSAEGSPIAKPEEQKPL